MKKFILLVALVFLTACTAQDNSIKSTDSAKEIPFLTYTRSGGFAGVNESWEFYSDGRMVSNKGEEKQAAAEDAQALMEQLRKADLAAMSKITPSPQNCADCFTIELIWQDGGEEIRLSIVPESSDAMPAAVNLVGLVQKYVNATTKP
jgi:hypothetical protein